MSRLRALRNPHPEERAGKPRRCIFILVCHTPPLIHNIFLMSSCKDFFILSLSCSASPPFPSYTTGLFIHIQKKTQKKSRVAFYFILYFLLFPFFLLLIFSGEEEIGIDRAVVEDYWVLLEAKEELGVGSGRRLEHRGFGGSLLWMLDALLMRFCCRMRF